VRGAKPYGEPNTNNGITIQFGDPGNGRDAVSKPQGFQQDPNDPNKLRPLVTVTIRPHLSKVLLDDNVSHEGTHIADRQDFAASISATGFDASKNLSEYETEFRAYEVSQSILSSANVKATIGDCGLDPCQLGSGVSPAQAAETINRMLANPPNHYGTAPNYGITPANRGPTLYPEFTTPH
jgi:hypothetical protein